MEIRLPVPPFASRVYFVAIEDDEAIFVLGNKLKELTAKWRPLGLQLHVPVQTLDEINAVAGQDSVVTKFQNMLVHWINNGREERRTWGFLREAVKRAGYNALASRIRLREDYEENVKVSLGVGELTEMLSDLTANWKKLAHQLHIEMRVQEAIDNPHTVNDCLMKMLTAWIKGTKMATFAVLIQALESRAVSFRALASDMLKDIEVLNLLEVPADAKDRSTIQRQLDDYIAGFR